MKVALVYGTNFNDISPGGVQNYLNRLMDSAPQNTDLTVFGIGKPPSEFAHRFVSVVDPNQIRGKLNWVFSRALGKFDFSEYDQVIFQRAENSLFVKKSKNQEFVLILHGGTANAWRSNKSIFSFIYPALEAAAISRSTKVFSVSVSETWNYFLFREKILRAPRVFDANVFNSVNVKENRQAFAIIGRLSKEKQFHLAIKALSHACEERQVKARLLIIGSGDEEVRLSSIPTSEFLAIDFLGHKTPLEVADLLKSDIRILLITSRFEGFPLVALEAVACRVKLIGINAPGVTNSLSELGFRASESLESFRVAVGNSLTANEPHQPFSQPKDESSAFWTDFLQRNLSH